MMDFVVVALIGVVPLLLYSLWSVKKGFYIRHKNLQIFLAIILLITVLLFELEMRLAGGIDALMVNSTYKNTTAFDIILYTHLFFAVSTPFLWAYTIFKAVKNFDDGRLIPEYISTHKCLGIVSVIDLVLTSVTGLIVYYMAFLCTVS